MRATVRVFGVALSAVAIVALTSTAAFGQGVDGGCTATVNDEDPSALTEDDPLKVDEDDTVDLVGTVPPDGGGSSKTEVYVIVAGFRVPVEDEQGTGEEWGDTVEVPNAIADLAPGIYRVEGEASGTGGWNCEGSAYVDVDGGPFTAAAAAGAGLFVVGALLADRGLGKRRRGDVQAVMAKIRPGLRDQVPDLEHDPRPGSVFSLVFLVAIGALAALAAFEVVELPEALLGATAPVAAARVDYDRVWLRGRPVVGFFGGLLMGLGIALVLHQLDVWPLDTTQGLAFPVAAAVLWAIRGWIGRAFLVVSPTTAPVVVERDEE